MSELEGESVEALEQMLADMTGTGAENAADAAPVDDAEAPPLGATEPAETNEREPSERELLQARLEEAEARAAHYGQPGACWGTVVLK